MRERPGSGSDLVERAINAAADDRRALRPARIARHERANADRVWPDRSRVRRRFAPAGKNRGVDEGKHAGRASNTWTDRLAARISVERAERQPASSTRCANSPVVPILPNMFDSASESCGICGGDGRVGNAFGDTKTCPGCRGSGRRQEDNGFRDVTKTKPSHHKRTTQTPGAGPKAAPTVGRSWPLTVEGARLATEVRDSAAAEDTKAKLIREIIAYEASHGTCTLTFSRKIRKQIRQPA